MASERRHSGEIGICVEAGLPLSYLWRGLKVRDRALRRLAVLALGTMAFTMEDVLLEPYGGEILGLSVSTTTMLTATLALQLVWMNRNQLYAAAPEWMAHLDSICHCQLGWPRQLHSVEVEQSTFQITPAASHLLQLSLKNQSNSTVATPDLMLTLIDATETAVIRKYFSHQTLQLPPQLDGGMSYPIDVKFQVPPRLAEQIVGFRAELFYP